MPSKVSKRGDIVDGVMIAEIPREGGMEDGGIEGNTRGRDVDSLTRVIEGDINGSNIALDKMKIIHKNI